MIRNRRTKSNSKSIVKFAYTSIETGLEVKVIRYTPAYLCKLFYRKGIRLLKYFSAEYYKKIKKILKKLEPVVVGNCYRRALGIYFDWAIRQAIEGHIIKLFSSNQYILKVYAYRPTQVEIKRMKKFYSKVPPEFRMDIKDFYLNSYRIGIFKLNEDGYYENTDYFLKLPRKYKELLKEQVDKDPSIYATNITI